MKLSASLMNYLYIIVCSSSTTVTLVVQLGMFLFFFIPPLSVNVLRLGYGSPSVIFFSKNRFCDYVTL